MKNIGSNIVDFLNKIKIDKMMKIVLNNKFMLLCLVFFVLFYYFYYSKSFKEGAVGESGVGAASGRHPERLTPREYERTAVYGG